MKNIKKYIDFVNENQKWKEILKPKPLDKVLQDLEKLKLSPQKKFKVACENGILPIVEELLKDERVDPSDDNNYAIEYASQNGHIEVVKELLKDERVDPSRYQVILMTSSNGHLEVVKELLKDGRVDPVGTSNYAIWASSNNNHIEVVKELLKDERVRNKLSKEQLERYENQIKNI